MRKETGLNKKRGYFIRYLSLAAFFVIICLIYSGRLIRYQIAGQDAYADKSDSEYSYRHETIHAQRGEIYDRNGVPLVVNAYTYNIRLDGGSMPYAQRDKNEVILSVLSDAAAAGEADTFTLPASPFTYFPMPDGSSLHFEYDSTYFESTSRKNKFYRLVTQLGCDEASSAEDTAAVLLARYGITQKDDDGYPILNYDINTAQLLLTLRLDMELSDFSAYTPYTLLTDVSLPLLTRVKESGVRGIAPYTNASRAYTYPGYASHILGRLGKIQKGYEDYFTELGYPLDAIVGIGGAEEAFESYLHGEDGVLTIVEDKDGNIVDQYVSKEPKAGSNVYLTIDIEMQITAEDALRDNIQYIVDKAVASGKPLSGEDAKTGALTALDSRTGEVLAMASYPTYNLATFQQDYSMLNSDENAPMYNRALSGLYAPGSTFKIGVAAAPLTEGIITPKTIIHDKGEYTYYSTYTPACWIYNQSGATHGPINVTTAIQVSCNYFFYEVGRLLTIETMNKYDRAFGLGVPTGIELTEKTGILAGPDYRSEKGLGAWNPGDTLAAAIRQAEKSFTPLQISVYMSSILNNGIRMKTHLLHKVEAFHTGEVLETFTPQQMDGITLGEGVRDVLLNAMKSVTENGSAARVFRGYPIEMGGKTGTAQVLETKSDNAIFTAFAPFNNPEIVVTCVIEQGANGTDAGFAVRDVFDYYFDVNSD